MLFQTQDGLDLHYEISGSGPAILCLPGLTRNAEDFDEFVEAFGAQATIIRLTFRGREPSAFDPNWNNYNITQEGSDAIALLDHLNIEKALWLGTSRGGLVTMAMAPSHFDRMSGAILNDIGPEMSLEGLSRIIGYLGVEPEYASLDEAAFGLQAGMGDGFPDLKLDDWRLLASRWFKFEDMKVKLRYDPKLRDAVLSGGSPIDLWSGFQKLAEKPFGMVWGVHSDLMTENEVLKMHEYAPSMKLARIENRGHVPFLNEPAALDLITDIFRATQEN